MEKIYIEANYNTCAGGFAELSEGKTWDDVIDWHIKWDRLFVQFKDESYQTIDLNSDSSDGTDWKYPVSVTIFPTDENGDPDYSNPLSED